MKHSNAIKNKSFFLLIPIFLFSISVIWGDSQTTSKLPTDSVQNLKAKKLQDGYSVELTWTPPQEEGEIIIARSNEILNTPEKLYYADSLGRFPSSPKSQLKEFKDINLKPGKYYYAIVTVKRVKQKKVELWEDVNYTSIPVEIGVEENTSPTVASQPTAPIEIKSDYSVSGLYVKHFKDYNQIFWTPPQNYHSSKAVLNVYRSEEPMATQAQLLKSQKIIELSGFEVMYIDKDLDTSKPYYYGVSVSIDGKEYLPLVEGISFARAFVPSTPKKEVVTNKEDKTENTQIVNNNINLDPSKLAKIEKEPDEKKVVIEKINSNPTLATANTDSTHIDNINYEIMGEGIQLFWDQAPNAVFNATTYVIYHSYSSMKNLKKLIEQGKATKLGEVVHPEVTFLVPKLERKRIEYFAVVVKDEKGIEYLNIREDESVVKVSPSFEKNITITKETTPEKKGISQKEPVKEKNKPQTLEFEKIMTDYYNKGKYSLARDMFMQLAFLESDKELRAKCLFYSALSNYNIAMYDDALKILLKEDLRKYYDKQRVEFYINQCIEKRSY
jgi:hypothetical protein